MATYAKKATGNSTKPGAGIRVPSGGFKRADAPVARRLICTIDGLDKQGKTHFGLTAPGPIAVINTDNGLDGVVQKFQSDKEIMVADYQINLNSGRVSKPTLEQMNEIASICAKVWTNIMRDYTEALDGGARTVLCDTGTELWEILRMARFGKLTQVMPHHYGPVNAEFRDFVRMAYDRTRAGGYPEDVNLIMQHKLKEEWKNGSDGKGTKTGEYERAGMKDIAFLVQVAAVAWREDDVPVPDCFHLTVTNCRHNPELAGQDLQGDMANFPTLAGAVLGVDPDEFK